MKPGTVLPWSWSKFNEYKICPRKFYGSYISKQWKQLPSAEMDWGNAVHKALENGVKYGTPLPSNMPYQKYVDYFRSQPGQTSAEGQVALTAELKPCGYWDANCWVRGQIDVVVRFDSSIFMADYKTGKKPSARFKPQVGQLDLMTGIGLSIYDYIDQARSAYLYLGVPKDPFEVSNYTRNDMPYIWEYFSEGVDEMLWSEQNNAWPAKPNGLCKAWCPDLSCPHNGKKA